MMEMKQHMDARQSVDQVDDNRFHTKRSIGSTRQFRVEEVKFVNIVRTCSRRFSCDAEMIIDAAAFVDGCDTCA